MSAVAVVRQRSNSPDVVWRSTPWTARPFSAELFARAHAGRSSESWCTAMTCATFTVPRPVDLMLAEFASLNNLADRRDLSRVFEEQYGVRYETAAGFALTSTHRCRYALSLQTFWEEHERFKLVQHGSLEADGRRARLDFEWLVPSGRMLRHVRETLWHVCWTDPEDPPSTPSGCSSNLVRSFRRPRRATEHTRAEHQGRMRPISSGNVRPVRSILHLAATGRSELNVAPERRRRFSQVRIVVLLFAFRLQERGVVLRWRHQERAIQKLWNSVPDHERHPRRQLSVAAAQWHRGHIWPFS